MSQFRVCFLLLAGLSATPSTALAGIHQNDDVGYKIKIPKDFESAEKGEAFGQSVSFNDPHVVDTFRCSKELSVSIPQGGSTSYTRRMWTVYIPERSAAEIAREREARLKDAPKEGSSRVVVNVNDEIYQSFEDWAKSKVQGFYFSEQKDTKVGGMPATIYEMVFDKLTWVPEKWYACAIKIPGGEFGIMCSLPEQRFDNYKSECNSCFKSFRMLDKGGLKAQGFDQDLTFDQEDDDVDESTLSSEELIERRERQKTKAFDKCRNELPDGWRDMESDHYLVVYECDPKYARKVVKHAEALRAWLEETFTGIGDGVAQASIIKVYENSDKIPGGHIRFYSDRGQVREIWFGEPTSKGYLSEFAGLNTEVLSAWLSSKSSELWSRMPSWLRYGLTEYVEDAELKGSRIEFGCDEWEKDRMNDARIAHDRYSGPEASAPFKSIQYLLSASPDEIFSGQSAMYARVQCSSFVRYLIDGPGARQSKTAQVLTHYIGNLYEQVDKIERGLEKERNERLKGKASDNKKMSDEERLKAEDEEYRKRRESAYDQVANNLRTDVFAKTFQGWDEKDWKALDSSWKKFADVK